MNTAFEKNNQIGVSVVEVIICLGIAAVIIFSISQALAATHRLNTTSDSQEKALNYAKQSLEILTDTKNSQFSCTCSSCTNSCTRPSDGQTCSLRTGYTSCWTTYANGLNLNSPLHLVWQTNKWILVSGSEIIANDNSFQRQISLENLSGNPDRKKITVKVSWTENNITKEISLSTILTAWENISP